MASRQERDRLREQMTAYRLTREARDELVLAALAAGFQVAEVHDFMGLGSTTIWNIRRRERERAS